MARTPGPTLQEIIPMKAIVVTDQAAGTAGMKLVERPEPQGASPASLSGATYRDVGLQVHASRVAGGRAREGGRGGGGGGARAAGGVARQPLGRELRRCRCSGSCVGIHRG